MTNTTPHRATAEQWTRVKRWAADKVRTYPNIILELRARIESLEVRDREDSDAWTGVRRANSELRARIEALEADATCPHIVSSDEGTSYCALAEQMARIGQSDVPANTTAPAGSLVERVAAAIHPSICADPNLYLHEARAAIRAVAEWLDTKGQHGCSLWLREEVE